jgi:signal transduction histidine kinase
MLLRSVLSLYRQITDTHCETKIDIYTNSPILTCVNSVKLLTSCELKHVKKWKFDHLMSIRVSRPRLVLFLLVSLFAVAQVSWWIILQIRVGDNLTRNQNQSWLQEIAAAKHCAETNGVDDPEQFRRWLAEIFPDLDYDTSNDTIFVRVSAIKELEDYTSRIIRIIVFEGAFFTFIVLLGLLYIYWTLRREAQIERHFSNFLASITHELKTPLTAMHLFVDALKIPEIKPEQVAEAHSSLTDNLNRLDSLIDKLLQARIRVVDKPPIPTIIDLAQETKIAIATFTEMLSSETLPEIKVDLPPKVFARVDAENWRILITNLVENAVKYTQDNAEILVNLSASKKTIELSVSDNGIGFEKLERNVIFERFYRIGDEKTRNSKGSGLGLYLAREITSNFGGSITAHSDGPGKGAVFTVRIPIASGSNDG